MKDVSQTNYEWHSRHLHLVIAEGNRKVQMVWIYGPLGGILWLEFLNLLYTCTGNFSWVSWTMLQVACVVFLSFALITLKKRLPPILDDLTVARLQM
jgi:hypothetical protein